MAFKYQEVELRKVMQFYADHFMGDQLGRCLDGSVDAEWWIDQAKGSVVFRLYETVAPVTITPVSRTSFDVHRAAEFLGRVDLRSLNAGQYELDDDEIIEHVRKRFGLGESVAVRVLEWGQLLSD